jgi:type IV pilus assembly protein PilM
MFSLFKKNELVGLDIGTSSVKAIQLKRAGKGFELVHLGIAAIPRETIVDGVIMDANAVVSAINQIFAENAIKTQEVAVAVSGHSVIVKKIRMTQMKEEELRESIQWEAEQYIPFPIEDVNIDFQIIGPPTAESQEMDIILVAVKKDIVNDYQAIISSAGLHTAVVDVDAFALENAYAVSYEINPNELVALVNLGAAVMTINILKNGVSAFTRDSVFILSGGSALLPGVLEFLSQNLEIPAEIANPLRNIKADPKKFDPEYLEFIAPQTAISVGLALRQLGDK